MASALMVHNQPYGLADTALMVHEQYYGDANNIVMMHNQPSGDAIISRMMHEQPYSLSAAMVMVHDQPYSIAGTTRTMVHEQPYHLLINTPAKMVHDQRYSILSGVATISRYNTSVTVNGEPVNYTKIALKTSRDQYCVDGTITLGSQGDYIACKIGDDVTVTVGPITCALFVESKSRSRGHGTGEYQLSCLSPTARLDKPYSDLITDELSGMASTIVETLADGYTVNWETVDWYIPRATLLPADQSPLEVIKLIAAAAGAVVKTEYNGELTITPYYPVAVPKWADATPDHTLSDAGDFFTVSEQFDHRDGYNVFLIGDQLTSDDAVTFEEEADNGEYRKYLRAYRTPWNDDFVISHTGEGAAIEDFGVVEELIEDEVIEVKLGEGKTSKPCYSIESAEWQKASLGTVTHSEDGTLSAGTIGQSLLKLSYKTKYHRYLVRHQKSEQVQVVLEDSAGELLATIVPVFGEGTGADSLAVIELDEVFNVDDEGNVKSTFEPEDRAGFLVHYDPTSLRICQIETSAGQVVTRGIVEREESIQMTWVEDATQTLTHLPQGPLSIEWHGEAGDLSVIDRTVENTGAVPSICDVTYNYIAAAFTLIPPVMSLGEGDKYPIVILVHFEVAE